jgi:ubiquinone/menaquinone biosynthesis C-methylase UbiE/ADP-ribose pyrophosphatase YjhB (NUDIX family)
MARRAAPWGIEMTAAHLHPRILSAAFIERGDRVLAAHRRSDRPPFGGQWLLPMTPVLPSETAEDAARRHTREQFGAEVRHETFADTVYLDDPDGGTTCAANIFRCELAAGPMRFRAGGDYDDARWLTAVELQQLWMPPELRASAQRLIAEPETAPEPGGAAAAAPSAEAVPLAEREKAPPPDNRAAWNRIARAYQAERYGDRFGDRLMWSWRASEDDLHVVDGTRHQRALVLGCGGGQDVVALAKMGALAVGIDSAAEQLAYAMRHATKHAADNAAFVRGDLQDLSRFDDESFDLAISIDALDYVEDIELALSEAARVLKSGSALALAVKHPYDVRIDGEGGPPYRVWTSYWTHEHDEEWKFKGARATFRRFFRTMGQWFDAVSGAGFVVERIIEPKEDDLPKPQGDPLDDRWLSLMPYTLIIKARKR